MKPRERFLIGSLGRPSCNWLRLSSARRTKQRQRYDARRERKTPARGCIGGMTMSARE
jgi:hypothetical protein